MSDTTKWNIASDKQIPDTCVMSGIDANGQRILIAHGCAVDKILQLKQDVARLESENAKMREALTLIAGGESANNAFEEVAWNMVQWAKAALAAEGGEK